MPYLAFSYQPGSGSAPATGTINLFAFLDNDTNDVYSPPTDVGFSAAPVTFVLKTFPGLVEVDTTATDGTGNAQFSNVPAGTYTMTASVTPPIFTSLGVVLPNVGANDAIDSEFLFLFPQSDPFTTDYANASFTLTAGETISLMIGLTDILPG